jgi:hypothetical protein
MSKLPLLEKNAYLSVVIKDNGIWSHLAYTDHDANREYILTDFTDVNPLRYRLDDELFTKNFWFEYFDNLEKVFSWDLVDRNKLAVFTFRPFKNEGDGLTGIRIQIDDNQKFFEKIFSSVRDFSRDISLRVIDDQYMYNILDALIDKSEYDDLMYIDMDLIDLSIFRVHKVYDRRSKKEKKIFSRSKISWNNDLTVIDSVRDARFRAFLGTDLSTKEIFNYWSNFVLNRVHSMDDPNLQDILRSYCTIQNHSLYRDNKEKLQDFGISHGESAIILSGYIPRILGKSKSLLTLIDGLELAGTFDCYWDLDMKLLSYGKSYVSGVDSTDIILTRKEVLALLSKVILPYVKPIRSGSKIIFSGNIQSLSSGKSEFFVLTPEYSYIELPPHDEKLVIEGEFKNGAYMEPSRSKNLGFVSTPGSKKYEAILIDARPRPIIYGPDSYFNKLKLQAWLK